MRATRALQLTFCAALLGTTLVGSNALAESSCTAELTPGEQTVNAVIHQALVRGAEAEVAWALGILRTKKACGFEDALAAVADRGGSELSSVALDMLASSGDHRALPLVEEAISSGDAARVSVGAVWLSTFGDAGIDSAQRLLTSRDARVRVATIAALRHFESSPRVEALLSSLAHHPDRYTASRASRVLETLRVAGTNATRRP